MKTILKSLYQNSRINAMKNLFINIFNKDSYVRSYIASSVYIPILILEYLSKDKDFYVRKVVAENPNTPIRALEYLSNDENIAIRKCATRNPNWINK